MKKLAFALFALVALSTGWYAYACDGCAAHAEATQASASDDDAGCSHAKKAQAKESCCKGGCSDAKTAGCGSATKTAGCASATKTAGCGSATKVATCGSAAKAATCGSAREADMKLVTYTGRVLCTHCNLKQTESCGTVFQMEGEKDPVAVCPHSNDVKGLRKAGDHGTKVLEVKGHMCEDEEGQKQLMVASWSADQPST